MRSYNLYIFELIIRIFYILFSYCLCLIIIFLNIDILFLFETYPFASVVNNRFISTCVTDFIDVIWTLSVFTSIIFTLPLLVYHLGSFFYNSWYTYQINFYRKLVLTSLLIFLFIYFIIHNNILPSIFSFFLYWEITEESSLLRIEAETRILSYIDWILLLKLIFSFLISLGFFILSIFLSFFKVKYIHGFFKFNKGILIYFSIFLFFLITPPDFFLQLFIIFFNLIFFNLIFFFYFVWNFTKIITIYKNAYFTSITKKILAKKQKNKKTKKQNS
uniref:Preprotein translocase subunit SecY n=1 Tax=Lithothamnion sp. TaxID=1940749 RepID=A0A3G3MID3_9FLOR|nr:preprotein translocase subunit SecY [Lithothamnion sp.]